MLRIKRYIPGLFLITALVLFVAISSSYRVEDPPFAWLRLSEAECLSFGLRSFVFSFALVFIMNKRARRYVLKGYKRMGNASNAAVLVVNFFFAIVLRYFALVSYLGTYVFVKDHAATVGMIVSFVVVVYVLGWIREFQFWFYRVVRRWLPKKRIKKSEIVTRLEVAAKKAIEQNYGRSPG